MKQFLLDKRARTSKLFNRKILLIMKLTVFLILLAAFGVKASGYAQKVSIHAKNESLEKVWESIKTQTGYYFLYDAKEAKKKGKINLDVKNVELKDVLDEVTSQLNLNYKIIDKTVIFSESLPESKLSVKQEEILIKGVVKSKEGVGQPDQALPGVVVMLKGTSKAINTGIDGRYSIKAPANATLVFSIIGYGTKEVAIEGKNIIDVVLIETASNLQEVIITAYGTKETKENQVGSAYQLTSKDLEFRPLNRIDQLLDGVVPGIMVEMQDQTASSARPRFQTRIRGESTFGSSNEPLWVIDGIPMNTGDETNMILGTNTSISPLTFLNPNDIESIITLKDATATSIYGANGANGVILITTKKGKNGADRVNYGFRTGVNLLNNRKFHVLSAPEYRELLAESFANNTSLTVNPVIDLGTSTDWYDVFFKNGVTTQHDLSFSGGNAKTKYYVSGAYFNEKPIMIKNQTQRFSSRINLDQNINKSIDLFFKMGTSYIVNNMFNPGNSYYINRPIDSPFDANGNYVLKYYNKLADAEYNDDKQKTMAMYANVGGSINIIPGLKYTTTNGIDYTSIVEDYYASMYSYSGSLDKGDAYKGQTSNFVWNTQHRFNYEKIFGKHSINALLGAEATDKSRRSVSATGYGFANDKIREVPYAITRNGTSSATEQSGLSYYGQLNYSWDRKYHLVSSFRGDANSDFGSDVRWATFKSIGASWTISNEKFWDIKQIDFAKLKLSYGTNGNSRIGAYKSKGIYSFSTDNNYNGSSGALMSNGENPVLSWETTYLLNAGLSLGLFKRISLDIEAYYNRTINALDDVDVTRTTGFTGILQNVGSIRNRGIEIVLNTQNIMHKDFEWRTSLNFSLNRNMILELYNNNEKIFGSTIRKVGEDIKTNYLIRWAGVDPRDGGPLWYDARGNLTKVFDMNNRVLTGRQSPDFFGGMTNTIDYKNFSLRGLFQYTVGGYLFSSLQRDAESDGRNLASDNQSRNQLDRWREPGDLTLVPKTVLNENADNGRNSTRFLHNRTAFRITNVSLNYRFPKELLSKISLNTASLYLQADNVAFWTPYKTKENYNDYKNSYNPYPQPLVLSFGLNVGF
jgi:TonB-linked SusC/RagA family outer membrane protein